MNEWWQSFIDGEMETKIKIKKILRRITNGHDYLSSADKVEKFRVCAEKIIKENPEADEESLYVLITCFSRILNFLFVIVLSRKNCLFDKQYSLICMRLIYYFDT